MTVEYDADKLWIEICEVAGYIISKLYSYHSYK